LHRIKLEAITAIVEVQKNVTISRDLIGDLDSDTSYLSLLRKKIEKGIFKDPFERQAQLSCFQEVAFKNFKHVATAINSNTDNLKRFTELTDKADRFKKWLADIPDDRNVVQEYIAAITKEHWIDKLPTKLVRWCMFLDIGVVIDSIGPGGGLGIALGISTSAFDSFLLDKIVKGWKPNIFVDDEFQKFLKR
jgi:hypothetical protein